jgi:hypothetical protein
MEAFLLTLDVVFMGLLVFAVIRVYRSGNEDDLGLFGYVRTNKKTPPPKNGGEG